MHVLAAFFYASAVAVAGLALTIYLHGWVLLYLFTAPFTVSGFTLVLLGASALAQMLRARGRRLYRQGRGA